MKGKTMALQVQHCFHRVLLVRSSGEHLPKEDFQDTGRSPAEQFPPLANAFKRRLAVGAASASLVGLGANFAGITSFLLGLAPDSGRNLKLDFVYPIQGYSRFIDTDEGFEFIYPESWVGDQTLLYRAAEKTELQRSLDPPPIKKAASRRNVNEPVVAFGPPGTSGELNVSVIVSPVPADFSIEVFGGPEEVGEAVILTITRGSTRPEVKGELIKAKLRQDSERKVKYYELEFRVEGPSFRRHNVAVCCAHNGKLFTLNAQAPELAWPDVESVFHKISDSFTITS